ncbi:MAG: hypothetical protein AAF726_10830 [Planctomycetota bacterium]
MQRALITTIALSGLLSGALGAGVTFLPQDDAKEIEPTPTRRYVLESGDALRGSIVGVDGSKIQLKVTVPGGYSTRWLELDRFEPKSQVAIRRALVPEGDLDAQLAVAEFAAQEGLVDSSRKELGRLAHMAEELDEEITPEMKGRAIDLVNGIVAGLCSEGRVGEARQGVNRLITRRGDGLTDEDRARLLATLDASVAEQEAAEAVERQAKRDAKVAAEIERELEPIHKDLKKGAELRRKGLLNSKKRGAAKKDLDKAVKEFESAVERIDGLDEKAAGNSALREELDQLRAKGVMGWQDSLLAGASLDLAQGKFHDAMASVNTILADDPKNKEALAMRARIEVAENDWGWWR